jgi:hypothetical protein
VSAEAEQAVTTAALAPVQVEHCVQGAEGVAL